ncbi:hypothetical protein E3T40_15835 [Cryobacterium sp. TMT1-19]|uniref:hypothetical protein n=1 Tax=unclassified Cryobacterium TaxID=2649013 RepID=UPI00106ABBA3|nr:MULTISPECIES: hypothetical protein [unclassified Cryobacterium]TFD29965.1 hypothetical protein E3T40_15835 [Cryobacterium sp. TMT1-19]
MITTAKALLGRGTTTTGEGAPLTAKALRRPERSLGVTGALHHRRPARFPLTASLCWSPDG